jgi:hypothetical protein
VSLGGWFPYSHLGTKNHIFEKINQILGQIQFQIPTRRNTSSLGKNIPSGVPVGGWAYHPLLVKIRGKNSQTTSIHP